MSEILLSALSWGSLSIIMIKTAELLDCLWFAKAFGLSNSSERSDRSTVSLWGPTCPSTTGIPSIRPPTRARTSRFYLTTNRDCSSRTREIERPGFFQKRTDRIHIDSQICPNPTTILNHININVYNSTFRTCQTSGFHERHSYKLLIELIIWLLEFILQQKVIKSWI